MATSLGTIPEKAALRVLANHLNRTALHGARVTTDTGANLPALVASGQECAVSLPPTGNLPFQFTLDAQKQVLDVKRADAAASEAAMREAFRPGKDYFSLAVDPTVPTWVFHDREFSLPENSIWEERIESPGLVTTCLPASVLREAQTNGGAPSTVNLWESKGKDLSALPPTDWNPSLLLRFPLRAVPGADSVFELSGVNQEDRWFLDQLFAPWDSTLVEIEALKFFVEAGLTREPIDEWKLVRTALSREGRPPPTAKRYQNSHKKSSTDYPYTARQTEWDAALRLLQLASVTNAGGYFLRATTTLVPTTLVVRVRFKAVFDSSTGLTRLPAAANAITRGATVRPATLRFQGMEHVQIEPFAPAGHVAFGWTRTVRPPTNDEERYGYGCLGLVDYTIRNASGTVLAGADGPSVIPISPLKLHEGEHVLSRAGLRALKRGQGVQAVAATHYGPPGAKVAAASQIGTVTHSYRATVRCYDPLKEGPYQPLLDKRATLRVAPNFRDIFGNRFERPLPEIKRRMFYTDPVVPPAEWPGFRFALWPTTRAGKCYLVLGMFYDVAAGDESLSRRQELGRILAQLKGARGDVLVSIDALPMGRREVTKDMIAAVELALKAEQTGKTPTLLPIEVPCDGAVSTRAAQQFDPRLRITRTEPSYLPKDELPADPTLHNRILAAVSGAESSLSLAAGPNMGEKQEFRIVAEAFETVFATAFDTAVGISRSSAKDHQLWFVHRTLFPGAKTREKDEWLFATSRPLGTTLGTGLFRVPNYKNDGTGEYIERKIVDVDVDVLGRRVMGFVESKLAPDVIAVVEEIGAVDAILEAKDKLGAVLSKVGRMPKDPGYIVPVYARQGRDIEAPGIERMAQDAFCRSLKGLYSVDTFVQLPLKAPGGKGIETFYGTTAATFVGTVPVNSRPAFSEFLIRDEDRRLTVLYDLPEGMTLDGSPKIKELVASIRQIQLTKDPHSVDGLETGRWIDLIEPVELIWPGPSERVPVALRLFPQKPVLVGCQATNLIEGVTQLDRASLDKLTRWGWRIDFDAENKATDLVEATVVYNDVDSPRVSGSRKDDVSNWPPQTPLHALLALQVLEESWEAINAHRRFGALATLLGQLCATLAPKLGALGAETPVRDVIACVGLKKTEFRESVVIRDLPKLTPRSSGGAGELRPFSLTAAADGPSSRARLLAAPAGGNVPGPVHGYRPTLLFTRNERIDQELLDARLVYCAGPVQAAAEVAVRNSWRAPLRYAWHGSLEAGVTEFLLGLFNQADGNAHAIQVTSSLHFRAGALSVTNPLHIFPADDRWTDTATLAKKIVEQFRSELRLVSNADPITNATDGAALRLRIQVSLRGGRVLVDIDQVDFELGSGPLDGPTGAKAKAAARRRARR